MNKCYWFVIGGDNINNILKSIFSFEIPYWHSKSIRFSFARINYQTEIVFRFSIWWIKDINKQYLQDEDERCLTYWKHYDIFRYNTKEGKLRKRQSKNETIGDLLSKMEE